MTRNGVMVSETTYRMNWTRREHWKHAQETMAQAALTKAVDRERTRQADLLHQLEEITKTQNVRRIRVRYNPLMC